MTPQKKIAEIAGSIISGEVGLIAGSRQLWRLGLDVAPDDRDILFLSGVASGSDEFYVTGDVRQRWNPEALRAKDAELAAYEAGYRERVFEICRRLIQRYDHAA
jgi:hypothetical protein